MRSSRAGGLTLYARNESQTVFSWSCISLNLSAVVAVTIPTTASLAIWTPATPLRSTVKPARVSRV